MKIFGGSLLLEPAPESFLGLAFAPRIARHRHRGSAVEAIECGCFRERGAVEAIVRAQPRVLKRCQAPVRWSRVSGRLLPVGLGEEGVRQTGEDTWRDGALTCARTSGDPRRRDDGEQTSRRVRARASTLILGFGALNLLIHFLLTSLAQAGRKRKAGRASRQDG